MDLVTGPRSRSRESSCDWTDVAAVSIDSNDVCWVGGVHFSCPRVILLARLLSLHGVLGRRGERHWLRDGVGGRWQMPAGAGSGETHAKTVALDVDLRPVLGFPARWLCLTPFLLKV